MYENVLKMNKYYLQSKIKSTATAYLCWVFFGAHYAYLGRGVLQILYWITLEGLGIWMLIDLFVMSGKVNRHNVKLFQQIEEIEKKEKDAEHARNMAMIVATTGNRPAT